MPQGSQAIDLRNTRCEFVEYAERLLSQQIWCWGRDIMRSKGNWLIEVGFDRLEPPPARKACASVYALTLPRERCVVLRGFGVFYGDSQYGGVFLPRFEFRPKFTTEATLERPPWSSAELPQLDVPTDTQKDRCVSLTLDLIDWIRTYEFNIAQRLGIEYRKSTLVRWSDDKRPIIPAEEMAPAWRSLGVTIAKDPQILTPLCSESKSQPHD